jgi:AcrR family transcriptional regulator
MKKLGVDRRIVNTKRKLGDALLKLIQEKHISQVTVQTLCDEAGVNRGTFYKYYSSPYDVILSIENEIYNSFKTMVSRSPLPSNPNVFIYSCLKLMKRNETACKALLIANEYRLISRLFELVHESCLEYWRQEFNVEDQETLDQLYTFVSFGVMGIIKKWAVNSYDKNPSELSNFINAVSDHGVASFSQNNINNSKNT